MSIWYEHDRDLRARAEAKRAEWEAKSPHGIEFDMKKRKELGEWVDHEAKDGRTIKYFKPKGEFAEWLEHLEDRAWRFTVRDADVSDPIDPHWLSACEYARKRGRDDPRRRVYGVAFADEKDTLLFKFRFL